ncbi:MAG: hypothetical protein KAY37_08565 [Phycisphaerae bacterium]|nr:hypothetical protein [Phycisphaerae bacterium]
MRRIMGATACGLLFALLMPPPAGADSRQYGHGSIVGWGEQVFGGDMSAGFVAVAGGDTHSLGLKADGSVAAWGGNR